MTRQEVARKTKVNEKIQNAVYSLQEAKQLIKDDLQQQENLDVIIARLNGSYYQFMDCFSAD
jgi:hypothetical protein